MQVYGARIIAYYVLCSKPYRRFCSVLSSTSSRQAAKGARICEISLSGIHVWALKDNVIQYSSLYKHMHTQQMHFAGSYHYTLPLITFWSIL